MKTPREILFEQHNAAQSKLNAARRNALAALQQPEPKGSPFSLRNFLWSIRWHFAGMSAIWLIIAALNLDSGHGSQMVAAIPPAKIPPPQTILASLRENRRQLSEMIEGQPADSENRKPFAPQPRSERHNETLLA